MSSNVLILALLALSFPGFSYGQSLGDIAREIRAERQKSGSPQPKVITNEDLPSPVPAHEIDVPANTPSQNLATDKLHAANTSAENARELKTQKHTSEVNKSYLDRIAALRNQINNAQSELKELQGDYINRWTIPLRYPAPYVRFREQQALTENQQISDLIEAQNKRLDGLKLQLQDLQEEARHAGVPHATD